MDSRTYFDNEQIALHSICASIIVAISIINSFFQIQYIADPFLIPFVLVFFKLKKPHFSMLIAIMITSVIIIFYKPRLMLFLFAYMFIGNSLYKLNKFFSLKNIIWLSLVYAFWFYLSYLITFLYIYGYKMEDFIHIFTGFSGKFFWLGILLIIYEPILYSLLLILSKGYIIKHYV